MRVPPTAPLTRLGLRFNERRERAARGETSAMTESDEKNITAFTQVVEQLSDLLQQENEALQRGDIDQIAEIFQIKQELLRRLETRQPVVEPFLRKSADVTEILRERIGVLAGILEVNATLLGSMAEAAHAIRGEVGRVRDRHSLKGMYNKSGQAREGAPLPPRKLDTNF